MAVAAASVVRKQIAAGTPDPIYLLQGEDDVEKAALASEFESLVEDDLRAFNVERIQAGDLTTGDRVAAVEPGRECRAGGVFERRPERPRVQADQLELDRRADVAAVAPAPSAQTTAPEASTSAAATADSIAVAS